MTTQAFESACKAAGIKDLSMPTFCVCCGRVLTHPKSIARGFGPECAEKMMPDHSKEDDDE